MPIHHKVMTIHRIDARGIRRAGPCASSSRYDAGDTAVRRRGGAPPRFNAPRPAGPAPFVPSPPPARELGYDTATQHPGPCVGAGHRRRPLPHRAPCGASGRWREGKPEGAGKRGNQSPDACAGASHELRHRAAPRLPLP